MTNGMHAQKALAYDVAIGCCHLKKEDLYKLRMAADWRHLDGLEENDSHCTFLDYFRYGKFIEQSVEQWVKSSANGRMPSKIVDQREIFGSKKGKIS
ncbi:hypothetical protein F2P45_07635 [Massilia sp. CCM 8733]|uniref:Uncharacterized protein n=1 Tax=Massilia mucilaginosa TaxID=2609282 RepID=A0ABX0NQ75_9BURK|nr:hypothetical protein [Massilia mucilaginosa]NHZ88895.1 hypothetical protein [Massilia mucilaginosa]